MRFFSVTFFCFLTLQIVAQKKLSDNLRELREHPILKEKVFIHSNKTAYTQDDIIWFKAYVADDFNYPSLPTKNLYVNLIDAFGSVVGEKNVLIENGVGFGQFDSNPALPPGLYYLQAYTNYMRNFGDAYHYLHPIQVQGYEADTRGRPRALPFEVQIFPEGGNLLGNIENTVAITAFENGLHADFKGRLLDSNGKSIVSFKSQYSGMAKFNFHYKKDETYTAELVLNDTVLTIDVPKAKRKGIALQLDNTESTYLKVYLKTNTETYDEEAFSKYSLLFHQNHKVADFFSLTRIDSLNGLVQIKKELFFEGVNTLTLFREDVPIARRNFFIDTEEEKLALRLEELDTKGDSISFKLHLPNIEKSLEGHLSISVLSTDLESFKNEQDIRTTFLLTSFLEGYIENPSIYFDTKDLKSMELLDLLLLTQKGVDHDFVEKTALLKQKPKYDFEFGIDLKGKVDSIEAYESIALFRDDYQMAGMATINEDHSFSFNNLLMYKGDTVKVAFIDKLGKVIVPRNIMYDRPEVSTTPKANFLFGNTPNPTTQKMLPENKSLDSPRLGQNTSESFQPTEDTIVLDEAIVAEKKRSEAYLKRRKTIRKYKPIVSDIGRYYDIPIPEMFLKYNYGFLEYLKSQGIREVSRNLDDNHYVDAASREILVQIDGRTIPPDELSGLPLRMNDIENILVSNEGNINGKLVFNTIYQVFTKRKHGKRTPDLFSDYPFEYGFDRPQKYRPPMKNGNVNDLSGKYEIAWKPVVIINGKGEAIFKIAKKNTNQKMLFFIQGFTIGGHLISETITME